MKSIKISKTQELISKMIDGEMVLLNVDTGDYFLLNKVGAFIWELLERSATSEEIISKIEEKYEVTMEQAESDYQRFLSELEEKRIISISESI